MPVGEGRVGFVADKSLIYLKGGAAWADTEFSISNASAGASSLSPFSFTTRNQYSGAFLGAGVEYAFLPNWSAKLEYDFYDFGTKAFSIPFSFAFAGGINTIGSANSDLTVQTIKFGFNCNCRRA